MKRFHSLVLVLLFLLSACSKRIQDLPPQTWQGYEVKVLSVESKGANWTSSQGMESHAKEGSEIVVAAVNFKPLSGPPDVRGTIVRADLEDKNGRHYEMFVIGVLGKEPLQFPFEVPKGAALKTLRVNDLIFDLT